MHDQILHCYVYKSEIFEWIFFIDVARNLIVFVHSLSVILVFVSWHILFFKIWNSFNNVCWENK